MGSCTVGWHVELDRQSTFAGYTWLGCSGDTESAAAGRPAGLPLLVRRSTSPPTGSSVAHTEASEPDEQAASARTVARERANYEIKLGGGAWGRRARRERENPVAPGRRPRSDSLSSTLLCFTLRRESALFPLSSPSYSRARLLTSLLAPRCIPTRIARSYDAQSSPRNFTGEFHR